MVESPSTVTGPVGAVANLLRGFLIGMAELVPGVSGGTVALVTGVYDRLIGSASHVVGGATRLVRGPDRVASARAELGRADWWVVAPVLVGMATAVLTVAGAMEGFVSDHPEQARGLFLGLVVASLAVPLRMAREAGARGDARDVLVVLGAAVVAFLLVGLAGGREVEDPALPVVALAAAVAICALVVPGVSGSFFLLAVGLYGTTLSAVADRDLVYIGAFALGAVAGLATFVQLLGWLLEHRRRVTLLAMAGLMVGSLRALWPWQGGSGAEEGVGSMTAPYDPVLVPVLLALLGAVVVTATVRLEARLSRS